MYRYHYTFPGQALGGYCEVIASNKKIADKAVKRAVEELNDGVCCKVPLDKIKLSKKEKFEVTDGMVLLIDSGDY